MRLFTEGLDTETQFQRSLFAKLAVAYVVNMVIVPLVIGFVQSGSTSGQAIDQERPFCPMRV